jgi:hypothetical protein
MACEELYSALSALEREKADLQADLHGGAGTPAKWAITAQIREIQEELEQKRKELLTCLGQQPGAQPGPVPIVRECFGPSDVAIAGGGLAFTARSIFTVQTATLTFTGVDYGNVKASFSPWKFGPFTIASALGITVCYHNATVSMVQNGTGTYQAPSGQPGHIDLPVSLRVSHEVGGPCWLWPHGSSTANTVLTTRAVTSAVPGSTITGDTPVHVEYSTQIHFYATGFLSGGALNGAPFELQYLGGCGLLE